MFAIAIAILEPINKFGKSYMFNDDRGAAIRPSVQSVPIKRFPIVPMRARRIRQTSKVKTS